MLITAVILLQAAEKRRTLIGAGRTSVGFCFYRTQESPCFGFIHAQARRIARARLSILTSKC